MAIYKQGTAQLQNIESITKEGWAFYAVSADSFKVYTSTYVSGNVVKITIKPRNHKTIHIIGSKDDDGTTGSKVYAYVTDTNGNVISERYSVQINTDSFDLSGLGGYETVILVFDVVYTGITITGITIEP